MRLLALLAISGLLFAQTPTSPAFPPVPTAVVNSGAALLTTNASEGPTTILTPAVAGLYRISFWSVLSTQGTGGTWQMCAVSNNGIAANTNCGASSNLTGTIGTTLSQINSFIIWAAAGQAIQQQIVFTAPTGSPVVSYAYQLERLQ